MRVCLLNWYANRAGGADAYTEALALGLAGRGHRVTVVCYDASGPVEAACRVVRVPKPDFGRWPSAWRVAPLLLKAYWGWHLRRLRGPTPDAVVCSPAVCMKGVARRFPKAVRVYLPHARIAPLEVAGTLAGNPSRLLRGLGYRVHARAERAALLRSATTVRFTQGGVDALRAFYHLPPRVRFDVIPPAVDVPPAVGRRDATSPVRLLAVGRLVESKNLRFLLDTLAGMRDLAWRLDVVGDGPEREPLETATAKLGLGDRVTFHGHRADTGRFYPAADLFAFPSRLESLGLVSLEAMAHAVPVLAVRADGERYQNVHHEVIRDGTDGLLAADERDFAAKLRACLTDPGPLAALGAAARETAVRRHGWDAALDRWEALLTELVAEPREVQ